MNFQVPQFIEIEDKIFGPLTFKQFIYIAGGAGAAFILWVYIPIHFISILFIIPVVALALALAFYKVNNRPFVLVLEAAFRYSLTHKLYIWKRQTQQAKGSEIKLAAGEQAGVAVPKLSQSKLKDLSWSLDVREKVR